MRGRGGMLIVVLALATTLAACGRATDDQINSILGITPTATLSAEQIAQAATDATSTAEARAQSAASGVAAGDATQGKRQFTTWCAGCHRPNGKGPDLLAAGGAGATITLDQLTTIIRDGTGHPNPPGPYPSTQLDDKQIANLLAYLNENAKK